MIVLDTQVALWMALNPECLSPKAKAAITRERRQDGLVLAGTSVWELGMLFARGRLRYPGPARAAVRAVLEATQVRMQDMTEAIALTAVELPAAFPGDPADRIIAATAIELGVALVTKDERIRASGVVETIW